VRVRQVHWGSAGAPDLWRGANCARGRPLNKGRRAAARDRFADRARYAVLEKSILRPPVRVWWLCRTRLMLSCATAPSGAGARELGFFPTTLSCCRYDYIGESAMRFQV